MPENLEKCQSVFSKAWDDVLNIFVTEEERNRNIFTFKKLELENFNFFFLKITQTD